MSLPKGLSLNHGYVQLRVQHNGTKICETFGLDSPASREAAVIRLADIRRNILLGKIGIEKEIPSKTFAEVARIFFDLWSTSLTPDGLPKHGPPAVAYVRHVLYGLLVPRFGKRPFESIRPVDIEEWRNERIKDVLGTTANREQTVLSSLFNHIEKWVKGEKISAFKLPPENPCQFVEKAKMRKRERVLTTSELSRLKTACVNDGDADLWEICKLALKSLLRKKDLERLEAGLIDTVQAKTGVRIKLPVDVIGPLSYRNFRKRWERARRSAQLEDVQFRDLRKTGANLLKMANFSSRLIGEFLGHTSEKTTERHYLVNSGEHLKPLAEALEKVVETL